MNFDQYGVSWNRSVWAIGGKKPWETLSNRDPAYSTFLVIFTSSALNANLNSWSWNQPNHINFDNLGDVEASIDLNSFRHLEAKYQQQKVT